LFNPSELGADAHTDHLTGGPGAFRDDQEGLYDGPPPTHLRYRTKALALAKQAKDTRA
jgi:hypothetical protein